MQLELQFELELTLGFILQLILQLILQFILQLVFGAHTAVYTATHIAAHIADYIAAHLAAQTTAYIAAHAGIHIAAHDAIYTAAHFATQPTVYIAAQDAFYITISLAVRFCCPAPIVTHIAVPIAAQHCSLHHTFALQCCSLRCSSSCSSPRTSHSSLYCNTANHGAICIGMHAAVYAAFFSLKLCCTLPTAVAPLLASNNTVATYICTRMYCRMPEADGLTHLLEPKSC